MKVLKEDGLKIVDFPDVECIEIAGVRYSYNLFKCWGDGGMKINTLFRIIKRSDKTFTVEQLNNR